MMKRALVILLLMALPAAAQDQSLPEDGCGRDEPYADCLDRLIFGDEVAAEVAADAAELTAEVADGMIEEKVVPEAAPGAASSLRDFLPVFFGSLGLGGVTEEDGELTLTFNPALFDLGPDNPLSLRAVVRDPVPFDALVQKFPEDIRADRKSAFEAALEDFDDVAFDLSWSRESERFGRDYSNHRRLLSDIFAELNEQAQATVPTTEAKALTAALEAGAAPPGFSVGMTPNQVEQLSPGGPAYRALLDERFAAAAREIGRRHEALVAIAGQQRFFELDNLINNQPQIIASAVYRRRADLVGPDDLTAKLSFEIGFANVNGLRRHCRDKNGEDSATVDSACLKTYLETFGATLENSPRLTISADYSQTDEYDFALPADDLSTSPFAFHLDRIRKGTGKVAYGRYLRSTSAGVQTTRLDVEANYEMASGDPMRHDRFLAIATFTQRMTGDVSASLSAVWANRPEFRGEVDEELSARFGFKYKIDRQPTAEE